MDGSGMIYQAKVMSARADYVLQVNVPALYGASIVAAVPVLHKDSGAAAPEPGDVVWVMESIGGGLVWLGVVAPIGVNVEDLVGGQGYWEVVVAGVPAEAVTTEDETDWLYAWVGA
jgi:hypothetical protein